MKLVGIVSQIVDKDAYRDNLYRVTIKVSMKKVYCDLLTIPLDYRPSLGEPVEIEINIGGR